MIDLAELKRRRQAAIAEMRRITTEAQKRDDSRMTEQEGTRWQELDAETNSLAEEITRGERMNKLEMEDAPGNGDDTNNDDTGTGGDARGSEGFGSFGEYLLAVRSAVTPGQSVDERLVRATGANETVPSDAGFLVGKTHIAPILKRMHEVSVLAGRCTKLPVGPNANGITINAVDETSRATGSRWGGVQGYWASEAGTVTASRPKFRQMELKLKKLMALLYATDEALQDATALGSIMEQAASEELAWLLDEAIMNGPGGGQPLGFMLSPSVVTVDKEPGQPTASIVYENIVKMRARLYARSRANSVWYINQDCEPQLHTMAHVVGSGGVPVYLPANGIAGNPYDTLYGRPLLPTEFNQTVGTKGDIVLADLSQYLLIDKNAMEKAVSIHVQFLYAEQVFRFIYRVDGQPIWNAALTPAKGTNTLSPFVALAVRT